MPQPELDEGFDDPRAIDPRLRWWNPPRARRIADSRLTVVTTGGTDLWQRTHYGFRVDNAHCLLLEPSGDFVLTTEVRFRGVHQYDQAGLVVRLSAECWLKTSVEHEPEGPSRLGAVVTNHGWSDWSTQDVPPSLDRLALRVRRRGGDYIVEHAVAGGGALGHAWSQLRIAHLAEDDGQARIACGLYACSPQGEGYEPEFEHLRLWRGRLDEG
jgi:regulation of enolase protein 1 (concanavalin A-like superfamily)